MAVPSLEVVWFATALSGFGTREYRLWEEGACALTGYKSMRWSAWPRPIDRTRRLVVRGSSGAFKAALARLRNPISSDGASASA
jgi:hypothetical protein